MNHLNRIRNGECNLSNVPTDTLKEWSKDALAQGDENLYNRITCEFFYRPKDKEPQYDHLNSISDWS